MIQERFKKHMSIRKLICLLDFSYCSDHSFKIYFNVQVCARKTGIVFLKLRLVIQSAINSFCGIGKDILFAMRIPSIYNILQSENKVFFFFFGHESIKVPKMLLGETLSIPKARELIFIFFTSIVNQDKSYHMIVRSSFWYKLNIVLGSRKFFRQQ